MPLKFIGPTTGTTSDAAEALNYAVAEGVKISNNSYGCAGCFSQTLFDAVKRADAAGHLFVAAAGNDGADNDATAFYPANLDSANVVSVAATDSTDALASFSNQRFLPSPPTAAESCRSGGVVTVASPNPSST